MEITYFKSSATEESEHFFETESSVIPPEINSTRFSTAEEANCFSRSSFFTPSTPILSSLSKVMQTESIHYFWKPIFSSISFKTRLSLMLIVKSENPIFSIALAVISINSTSALQLESPKISISH